MKQVEILYWALKGISVSSNLIDKVRNEVEYKEYTEAKRGLTEAYIKESIREIVNETHPYYSGYVVPEDEDDYYEITEGFDYDVYEYGDTIIGFRIDDEVEAIYEY